MRLDRGCSSVGRVVAIGEGVVLGVVEGLSIGGERVVGGADERD